MGVGHCSFVTSPCKTEDGFCTIRRAAESTAGLTAMSTPEVRLDGRRLPDFGAPLPRVTGVWSGTWQSHKRIAQSRGGTPRQAFEFPLALVAREGGFIRMRVTSSGRG